MATQGMQQVQRMSLTQVLAPQLQQSSQPSRVCRKGSTMTKRVVLAYSGGLDTSVAVRWIKEEWGFDVIALAVDVGQQADDPWDVITERARAAGATEAMVVDARAEFATDFLVPAIHANAKYEGKYPLVSALSRPVIARHLVTAEHVGGTAVAAELAALAGL